MKRRVAPLAAIPVADTQRILFRNTGPSPVAGVWLRTRGNAFGDSEHRR